VAITNSISWNPSVFKTREAGEATFRGGEEEAQEKLYSLRKKNILGKKM